MDERRVDQTGGHRVDAYSLGGVLERGAAGQADACVLGRDVPE
jgi:hypothetical protein